MAKKSFTRHRRQFLSNSLKVVAGVTVSAALPRASAQGLGLASPLPSGFHEIKRALGETSMLIAKPAELGSQLFAGVPKPLRSSALQLQSLLDDIKPACRLSITVDELRSSITYLKSLDCKFVIEQVAASETLYAQLSPRRRQELTAHARVRVYLAKSAADARRVARLETEAHDYYALGLALGYPVCCVEAAAKQDQPHLDEEHGVFRQANLNAAAVRASSKADFRCNQFLAESDLEGIGPLSAIAHYPCTLNCRETAAMGQIALESSARKWPIWTVTLCELLRAPVLYWSDDSWPPEYWDEYSGLALLQAREVGRGEWRSLLPATLLGSASTPAGTLPESIVRVKAVQDWILFEDATGKTLCHSLRKSGHPWMIDWRSGKVEKIA